MSFDNSATLLKAAHFGSLEKILSEIEPGTMLHADEVNYWRRQSRIFHDETYWVADGAIYTHETEGVYCHLVRAEHNPIFQHKKEALSQFTIRYPKPGFFELDQKEFETALKAQSTLRFKVDSSVGDTSDERFVVIDFYPSNPKTLTHQQGEILQRPYGVGPVFFGSMAMMRSINESEAYFLHPDIVRNTVKKGRGLALACRLASFEHRAFFDAMDWIVSEPYSALSGVKK